MIENLNKSDNTNRFIVIIQHSLSKDEFIHQYDRYPYLNFLRNIDKANLYLMDSEGKLYEEAKNISFKKPKRKS